MNDFARIYRAEILRAVLGPKANELKAHDIHRLNQFADRLFECEQAHQTLHARGYGRAGMGLLEAVREVPVNGLGRIKNFFTPKATRDTNADLREILDVWTAR